jgi:hypothetical protein
MSPSYLSRIVGQIAFREFRGIRSYLDGAIDHQKERAGTKAELTAPDVVWAIDPTAIPLTAKDNKTAILIAGCIGIDILVAIACVIGTWPWRWVEITQADIMIIGPRDVYNVFFPVSAGVQFDIVSMEGRRSTTEQQAVAIVRHVGNPDVMAERQVDVTRTVSAGVVDVESFVPGRHTIAEVVPWSLPR